MSIDAGGWLLLPPAIARGGMADCFSAYVQPALEYAFGLLRAIPVRSVATTPARTLAILLPPVRLRQVVHEQADGCGSRPECGIGQFGWHLPRG